MFAEFFFIYSDIPPPFYASPAHGDGPFPSAGQEYSVQQMREGAEPDAVWMGPVANEWVGSKLEGWGQGVTAVPGDGGHLLVLYELVLQCPRHHG